jgi:GDP-D-mannose dehydratase
MGNLDSLSDREQARDYWEMQWRMLQQEQPENFVIAMGRQESVRRFIELATSELGWAESNGRAKSSTKQAFAPTPAPPWCASTRAISARLR